MALTRVTLRCPDCGSTDIQEIGSVPTTYTLDAVSLTDNGDLVIDYGESDPLYDATTWEGFSCAEYCAGRTFPTIDRFIVKDERSE